MTPERDGLTNKACVAVLNATLSADNTPVAIDVRGCRRATLLLGVGIGGITFDGTNKVEFVLTHSPDNVVAYVPVTDADVIKDANAPASISNGIIRSLIAAHAAADVQALGYIGGFGYLKLLADFSGTHGTGTPISAVVVKEDLEVQGAA